MSLGGILGGQQWEILDSYRIQMTHPGTPTIDDYRDLYERLHWLFRPTGDARLARQVWLMNASTTLRMMPYEGKKALRERLHGMIDWPKVVDDDFILMDEKAKKCPAGDAGQMSESNQDNQKVNSHA